MIFILEYIVFIFNRIVTILNIRIFPDMPITYFQFILSCLIIVILFKFLFGSFKEIESNVFINTFNQRVASKAIGNIERKKQINGNFSKKTPKWLGEDINPKLANRREQMEMDTLLSPYRD